MRKSLLFILVIVLSTWTTLISQESTDSKPEYLPDLDGILKTKFEYDLNNSLGRFEVRNARFGVKGKINPFFSYRAELDLSDEGVIKMLDAYVKFTPVTNLDFYMGQRKIPFSTDYMRSPAENFFANRSFVAKYIAVWEVIIFSDHHHSLQKPIACNNLNNMHVSMLSIQC